MCNKSAPIIFGEVLYDCFPDGASVLGGAPFNVAWHCQAFGLQPLFISRVGNDSLGKQVQAAMLNWGMKTEGIQIDSDHPTGRVDVSFSNNEPSYDIVENSAWDFITNDELPKFNKESLLYHGSLALRNSVAAQSLETIKQEKLKPTFVDINLRSPWWKKSSINNIMQNIQYLKINEDELNLIVSGKQTTENKARFLLSDLQLDLIVVTLGAAGAIAIDHSKICMVQPEKSIEVVDTVGAGDAFTSVLLLGLTKSWPIQKTIDRAQQFASQVVGLRGATTQDIKFYQPFIENWSL